MESLKPKINILGPCAAESETQILTMARVLNEHNVGIMRASWWKPRTKPTRDENGNLIEGVGIAAAPWFANATRMGLTVATEVMIPDHVSQVMHGIVGNNGIPEQVLLWLGSRNQNHLDQREIAKTLLGESPEQVRLMIKNQPWLDEKHWLGIVDHVTDAGFPPERILLCHRGFAPGREPNPNKLRNLPDWEMAMRVKEKTGLPMLVDPSHIGGSRKNVWRILAEAAQFPFDGVMLEVHPNPDKAVTDAQQQLSIADLDQILQIIGPKPKVSVPSRGITTNDASLDYQ